MSQSLSFVPQILKSMLDWDLGVAILPYNAQIAEHLLQNESESTSEKYEIASSWYKTKIDRMMNKCWDKFTTSIVTTYTPDFFSELVATDWPPPPPVNLATVQIFGLTKTTFRSRLLSAPVTLSPGRSRTVWIMKAMISDQERLH